MSTLSVPKFGTDGIRGVAGRDLTPEVALALGRAAAQVIGDSTIVIGADTRESCPMLVSAFTAGAWSMGVDTIDLGTVPTPTVAAVAAQLGFPAAMVSASHNPYSDNGIKLFGPGGLKLRADAETEVQDLYVKMVEGGHAVSASDAPPSPGSAVDADGAADRWVDLVVGSVDSSLATKLAGRRIVIDCAHGASYLLGPRVFERLGLDVTVIGAEPDGSNINNGVGSTHPEALCKTVVDSGADLGFAFDGDADRVLAVDGNGCVVDGDRLLALLAVDWAARGQLASNTVVVTVMTNLGFHRAMAEVDISVVSTAVGDKHVLAALDDHGYSLGGEQSGHVICRRLATTGDGVLTAIQLLDVVSRSNVSFAEQAAAVMETVPQILRNVRLERRNPDAAAVIADDVVTVEQEFGSDGRVVVRPSGTEPLLRIMVEHLDSETAEEAVDRLESAALAKL